MRRTQLIIIGIAVLLVLVSGLAFTSNFLGIYLDEGNFESPGSNNIVFQESNGFDDVVLEFQTTTATDVKGFCVKWQRGDKGDLCQDGAVARWGSGARGDNYCSSRVSCPCSSTEIACTGVINKELGEPISINFGGTDLDPITGLGSKSVSPDLADQVNNQCAVSWDEGESCKIPVVLTGGTAGIRFTADWKDSDNTEQFGNVITLEEVKHCENGVKDADEFSVDCGGGDCGLCEVSYETDEGEVVLNTDIDPEEGLDLGNGTRIFPPDDRVVDEAGSDGSLFDFGNIPRWVWLGLFVVIGAVVIGTVFGGISFIATIVGVIGIMLQLLGMGGII